MRGEIIAIGDELVCGKSLDTNSRWLAERLSEAGVAVRFHTTIGDQLDDYLTAFQIARGRAEIVVCSGGLGPTEDDLTRAALAAIAGVPLEFDAASWQHIQDLFGRRQRPVPEKNRVQALFPRGSRIIPNPHGTAPGIDLTVTNPPGGTCRFFALPGVPAELYEMWGSYAAPVLQELAGGRRLVHHTLRCFGAGESDIEQMIPPEIMQRGRDPLVGITASDATISLRAATFARSDAEGRQRLAPTIQALRAALGELVFGEENETLADVVVARLLATQATLAVVDLGLRGLLGQWLAEADPSGRALLGCLEFPTANAATQFFAVPPDPSSPADLTALATAVQTRFQASFGLVIGPPLPAAKPGASPDFEVAVAGPGRTATCRCHCGGHPAIRRSRSAKQVLNQLRLHWLVQ